MTSSETQREYEVVVIGSGAGGSTLAYRLAERGVRVLIVEQGDYLRPRSRGPQDPVGLFIKPFEPVQVVGGPTKFYGAALYRMRESDFQAVEHEAGESPAWPITYADLEPYYGEAEDLYRVHGSSQHDPSEPFRSRPFPHPPLTHAPQVAGLIQRLRGAGASVASIPRGLDYGPGGKCVLCPTCDAYYCQLDAKMDAEIAALRPALKTGNVELLTRTECVRVLTDDRGTKAVGVVIRKDGVEQTVHAPTVVVCAGLPGSASLLIKSQNARHPTGLGNASGCVGRYYAGHSTGMVLPLMGLSKVPAMHAKTFAINEYYHGSPGWPYPTGVIQAAGQIPFWDSVAWWKRPVARYLGQHSLYCFYMTEAIPTRESGFRIDGTRIGAWTEPRHNVKTFRRLRNLAVGLFRRAGYRTVAPTLRSPMLWHTTGTLRFGTDPGSSVVDPNCQVHDIDGLYVVDASVLPSAGAVNTGLTIMALALRAGDAIAGRTTGGVRPPTRLQ